jgi:hypothetical protein
MYKTLWQSFDPAAVNQSSSTVKFYQNFHPVIERTIKKLDKATENIIIVKDIIKKLQPEISSMNY